MEVSFTFDASLLAGKEIVVFEAIGREGRIFATHADIDDEGQTVRFPEIHTTATVEGSHEVVAIGAGNAGGRGGLPQPDAGPDVHRQRRTHG